MSSSAKRNTPMPLDRDEARRFLRAEFGLDVAPDDPVLAPYLLAQLGLDRLEPEIGKIAGAAIEIATEAAVEKIDAAADASSEKALAAITEAHDALAETAARILGLRDGMVAMLEASERTKVLNDMIDQKIAALDGNFEERINALGESMDAMNTMVDTMNESAARMDQAVVALSKGRR